MKEARTLERPAGSSPREHEVGEHGVVTVATTLDTIVVRGVGGTVARLVGPDAVDILTEATPGRFSVRTSDAPEWPATANGQSWLVGVLIFGHGRAARTIELEVPEGCRLEASTASGAVVVHDVRGGIAVHTASGDVSTRDVTGDVRVRTASGRVSLVTTDRLAATVRTASGQVEIAAGTLAGLAVSTMSGRVEVSGTVAAGVDGTVSTASGRVGLALGGDVTIAVRTVSGRARASHAGAAPGDRGPGWVLGDGTARLAVTTISGAINLREPDREGPAPEPESAGGGPDFPASEPAPTDETEDRPDGLEDPGSPSNAGSGEATLAILRALERGEIGVDEAARRLETAAPGSHSDD